MDEWIIGRWMDIDDRETNRFFSFNSPMKQKDMLYIYDSISLSFHNLDIHYISRKHHP